MIYFRIAYCLFFHFIMFSFFIRGNSKYIIGHWPGGMGICLTSTLNHLLHCEEKGLFPVVYWQKSFYHNPHGFNNKTNEWEYYFYPVSNLKYIEGDKINIFGSGPFNYYHISDEKRKIAYNLICKYIKLNPIVQRKVDNFYDNNIKNKKTIAIHIRGTDKKEEDRPVAPEIAINEALKYADKNTQFFIATDEQSIFDKMVNLLTPRKIVYYDCYRSENGKPLHMRKKKPPFSQLGEDVIVEMWIMSKCDMLIHTLSNVSSIPLYINPDMQHVTLKGY